MGKLERGGAMSSSVFRILTIGLLVILGVLGYNYWTVVIAHRATNEKLTKLSADFEELRNTKLEIFKKLEACSEQLKTSGDETKRLKDQLTEKEALVTEVQAQEAQLKESIAKATEEKAAAEKQLESEKELCKESLVKEQQTNQLECDKKVQSSVAAVEASCSEKLKDVQVAQVVSAGMPINRNAEVPPAEQRESDGAGVI